MYMALYIYLYLIQVRHTMTCAHLEVEHIGVYIYITVNVMLFVEKCYVFPNFEIQAMFLKTPQLEKKDLT